METIQALIARLEYYVWTFGVPVGNETIPFIVIALLGTGFYLTLRLGFIQVRRLGHGFAVATGRYDDPNEPGDVSHFQALTTALSATVGIGNIAGVAMAIHWGGPGALFWMWVTAFLGMALKYSEVTLAQTFRQVEATDRDPYKWEGSVSGGPMYYIERGLGPKWKPVAIFFALALTLTSFLTGNGVQANTVADAIRVETGVPPWVTGAITATLVGLVIVGGIKRIGAVTGILAPLMAGIYVLGALGVIMLNFGDLGGAFALIVKEAFNPTAGVAGTGVGAVLVTMMWGVRRGLFSNEAGQGSAPIAHSAAKTDEPVSEGVVALLEPFIDTLVICTMTGLVIVLTGVWKDRVPTTLNLGSGDISWRVPQPDGSSNTVDAPASIVVRDGRVEGEVKLGYRNVPVEVLFTDAAQTVPFNGVLEPAKRSARDAGGAEVKVLHGNAAEAGAPLTRLAFQRGLAPIIPWGGMIVVVSVVLFGLSTAISWSYYGDRCMHYVFGPKAVLPYKIVFIALHFFGAITSLAFIWTLGDIALGLVTFPNLVAVVLLSGLVAKSTSSYFERKPWIQNAEDHKRWVAEHPRKKQ